MPTIRSTTLEKCDISKYRFRELIYFCLQYNEWKQKLKENCDTLHSANLTAAVVPGANSDATQSLAVRRAEWSRKCELVENTAKEVDPVLAKYILKAVTTEGISYNYLSCVMGIPCGKELYYKSRRKFYYLLSKKI